jgi:hypothetical protein
MTSPTSDAPVSRLPRWRRRLLRAVFVLALLALLWTLAVGWWLPRFLQPRIEAAASTALGAPFTLERIEIDPWTWHARAFGLRLGPAAPAGTPWLQVAEVRADVSIESVWRLAPVLRRLTVRAPQFEFERLARERYNITPMLQALAARPPSPPDSEPARFAVHNITLEDGLIHVVDRVGGSEHRIDQLRVGVPFLSNLPSTLEVDVQPQLDARVDGSPLHVQGRTQPFSEGKRSAVDLHWQQVDVAQWAAAITPLLPQPVPLAVQRGQLDLALQIAFEHRDAPAVPSLHIGGTATLSQVQASMPARGLQFVWDRLAFDKLDLRPLERHASVGTVTLQGPALDVDLPKMLAAPAGVQNPAAARASAAAPPAASAASSAKSGTPGANDAWQWQVDRIVLAEGRVLLHEPAWPKAQVLAPIQASITGLGSAAGKPAGFTLSLADAQGARVKAEGSASIAERHVVATADVSGLKPVAWLAPWADMLPVRLQEGSVALQARAEVGDAGWSLKDGAVQVAGLALAPVAAASAPPATAAPASRRARRASHPAAPDRLVVDKLAVTGVQVQAASGKPLAATVGALRLDGLDLKASRSADGTIDWLPQPAKATGSLSATQAPPSSSSPSPSWHVDELRCSGCAVAFVDRGVRPSAAFTLTHTDLTLRHLGDKLQEPIAFDLSATTGRSGRAKLHGDVRLQPLALRGRVDLAGVDLAMLQPYLDPYVNLRLMSAKASAAGDLRVQGTAKEPVASAHWRGKVALEDLRALDRLNDAEFLRFKNLSLDGADIAWRPAAFEADFGQVALDDFYGRVIINDDGRINLRDIVKHDEKEETRSLTTPNAAGASASSAPAAASAAAPASAAASAPESAPTPLRWRGIRLSGGEVDFTDNFIRPNYSARLTDIAGEISALAWNDPKPAEVKVTGKVDASAPLSISGTIHPLGARLHTDITAEARGIDITRLSTYSARYAGYGIDKGTLSATVHYRIDNGQLTADNHLTLDQLAFGAKVDSPNALKLPVLLAVSLLKDRNGVIDINLPISGSLDDPSFSIGGIIARVIVNLITKAVLAPFSLLSHAFGGGGQELSHVAFAPGSADVAPAIASTLDTLAKALVDRPALKLEITGRVDPAVDAPALQHAQVDRLLRQAKARATRAALDTVQVEPAERERWLEAAYTHAQIKGKPRNLIGMQKTLPAAEMEAKLLATTSVGDSELKALADRRADHVKAYLAGKVASERLLLTASKLDTAGIEDKDPGARVDFALK